MGHPGEAFGILLRRLRADAGLTQEELAERAGLSVAAVSALERGERKHPYPHTVRMLATALSLGSEQRAALERAVPRRGVHVELPAAPSSFIGREADLRAATELLASDRARLLTLTGPGGVGKTRLALAVAGELIPHFADGVIFVSFAQLADPTLLMSTIARALDVRGAGARPVNEVLHDYLRSRQLLLVLDTLEHLLAGVSEIAALLAAAPRLAVLATSRSPLRIQVERLYWVRPLAPPDATELFLQRAVLASTGSPAADPEVVAEICRRVDCLPLAIELAAARTRVLSVTALLSRLDQSHSVLTGGPRDVAERHQTLERTVAWSNDLLSGADQAVLRRLSVFAGGWNLAAAAAVAQVDELEAVDVHERLLDNSLVISEPRGSEVRFRMLDTIRVFAAEKLRAFGELEQTRSRHTQHYRDFTLMAGRELGGPGQPEWLDRLEEEHHNLRLMLDHLLQQRDTATVAETCYSILPFWSIRGHLSECAQHVRAALELGCRSGEHRARLLATLAFVLTPRGFRDEAASRMEEAAQLAQQSGDKALLMQVVTWKGFIAVLYGDTDLADRWLREADGLARAMEVMPQARAFIRAGSAHVAASRGRLSEADSLLARAEMDLRRLGPPWNLAVALLIHGRVRSLLGDYRQVENLVREAVEIFGRLEDVWSLMLALVVLGNAAAMRSRATRSARLFGAADSLSKRIDAVVFPIYRDLDLAGRASVMTQLGAHSFQRLSQEGGALAPDEVIALGLEA